MTKKIPFLSKDKLALQSALHCNNYSKALGFFVNNNSPNDILRLIDCVLEIRNPHPAESQFKLEVLKRLLMCLGEPEVSSLLIPVIYSLITESDIPQGVYLLQQFGKVNISASGESYILDLLTISLHNGNVVMIQELLMQGYSVKENYSLLDDHTYTVVDCCIYLKQDYLAVYFENMGYRVKSTPAEEIPWAIEVPKEMECKVFKNAIYMQKIVSTIWDYLCTINNETDPLINSLFDNIPKNYRFDYELALLKYMLTTKKCTLADALLTLGDMGSRIAKTIEATTDKFFKIISDDIALVKFVLNALPSTYNIHQAISLSDLSEGVKLDLVQEFEFLTLDFLAE